MDISSCYQLGYIQRTHGLKGEVQVYLDVDIPEDYRELESVLILKDDVLIPFFIEYIRIGGNKGILKFDTVDSIEDASDLVSSGLFLPIDQLPELEEDQFYFHEITGYTVLDQNRGKLGMVKEVLDLPRQAVIVLIYRDKEVLIPVSDDIIRKVDKDAGQIHVILPDGLIEVYIDKDDES